MYYFLKFLFLGTCFYGIYIIWTASDLEELVNRLMNVTKHVVSRTLPYMSIAYEKFMHDLKK
jgi:hypothetical protein